MPKVVQVLAQVKGDGTGRDAKERLKHAEKEASLAAQEIADDFPVLHGFAVVALWSWLEHFSKGLVALWLCHNKSAYQAVALQRLKVRLGEYLQLSKQEQAAYLVELLEQDLASPLKKGTGRFDSLLEPFGINGELPEGCSKTLFELQQVRNVIAHRNGRADRRFKSECPWIKVKLNDPIPVTKAMLHAYSEAAIQYLLAVLFRIGDNHGLNLRPKTAPVDT